MAQTTEACIFFIPFFTVVFNQERLILQTIYAWMGKGGYGLAWKGMDWLGIEWKKRAWNGVNREDCLG